MSEQYKDIHAWKCIKCGRVLLTERGIKQHEETCKYIPPVLDGQINMDDVIKESEEAGDDRRAN